MSDFLHKQIEDLTLLLDVSRQLGATLDLVPLLKRIEQAALQVLACERVTVFLYDRSTHELYSKVATGAADLRFPASKGIAGEAALTLRPVNVPDAYSDPRFNPQVDRATGFRTRNLLALAMTGFEGQLVGVLQLLNKHAGPFSNDDIHLAETLSALAGVAIQRHFLLQEHAEKQRLERDLDLAREIQRGCLPETAPQVAGYDVAGWNKPADQTGGDAFDFIPTAGGHLGLLVADATGHGIGPALMVAGCRAVIRALASTTDELVPIFNRTNSILSEDLHDGRFVTVCFALLDSRRHEVRFISGGHGPLLFYQAATGEYQEIAATTLPLGIVPELPPISVTILPMAPGDIFLMVTDGFMEWQRAGGEQFGTARTMAVIHQHKRQPCIEMIHALHEEVQKFGAGQPQLDDLTAVLIKRHP
ncbi:MAG: hypothetical protein HJJLKODD_02822 [Phycisphaerae bacterium]|nr:hypothetical protein [Phycisphaerae bacterium]